MGTIVGVRLGVLALVTVCLGLVFLVLTDPRDTEEGIKIQMGTGMAFVLIGGLMFLAAGVLVYLAR